MFSVLMLVLTAIPSTFADPGCSAVPADTLLKRDALVVRAVDACQEQAFAALGFKKYSNQDQSNDRMTSEQLAAEAAVRKQALEAQLRGFAQERDRRRAEFVKKENSLRKKFGLPALEADQIFAGGESADELAQQLLEEAAHSTAPAPNPDQAINVGRPRSGMGMMSNGWYCHADKKFLFQVHTLEPGKEKVPQALGFKACRPTDGFTDMNQKYEIQHNRGYEFFSVCKNKEKKLVRCDQSDEY